MEIYIGCKSNIFQTLNFGIMQNINMSTSKQAPSLSLSLSPSLPLSTTAK